LEKIRQNDQKAATELVEYLYPLVSKIVRRRITDPGEAEDTAQEVFLKVFRHLDRFRIHQGGLEPWVSKITYNTCLNRIRSQMRKPEVRWTDLSEGQRHLMEKVFQEDQQVDSFQATEAKELLENLMQCLSPKEKLIIEMMELEELDGEEISKRTGWSRVNIRVRAHRARAKMRKRVKNLLNQGSHESI